jgi:hypothetical protein
MKTARPRSLLAARAAFLVALAAATSPARADVPCLDDAVRLCPGISVGDPRLWACLKRNQFQLSSACVKNMQEVERRASEFNADCASDVYTFCPGIPAGGGRILECLRYHVGRSELSTPCESAVGAALEKLQEIQDACANDAAALCPGVQPGGGRMFLCLRSVSDQLSSRCRKAVNP